MPIYTYRCEDCGVRFERNQKFSDAPLTRCPECGKKALRKVYTPVGIVFKGSGFYSTDHRSPSGTRGSGLHGDEKPAVTPTESKPAESTGSSSGSSSNGSSTSGSSNSGPSSTTSADQKAA